MEGICWSPVDRRIDKWDPPTNGVFFSHVIRFSSSRFTTIVKSYEDLWFWLVGITLATFASRETAGLWRERRVREFRTDRVQKGEDICGDTKRING